MHMAEGAEGSVGAGGRAAEKGFENSDSKISNITNNKKRLWGVWSGCPKGTVNGREYAQIGGRNYSLLIFTENWVLPHFS